MGRSRVASNQQGQDLALKRAWDKSVACLYREPMEARRRRAGWLDRNARRGCKRTCPGHVRFHGRLSAVERLLRFNEGVGIKA